jgi:hypothetical protein
MESPKPTRENPFGHWPLVGDSLLGYGVLLRYLRPDREIESVEQSAEQVEGKGRSQPHRSTHKAVWLDLGEVSRQRDRLRYDLDLAEIDRNDARIEETDVDGGPG